MKIDLANKVVLVAGGTGGLGRAVSLAFLAEGAKVIATYRNPSEFDALRQSVATSAQALEGAQVDVTDNNAVTALISDIVNRNGRFDVLVNCVGAYAGGVSLWETDLTVFDRMFNLNLRSGLSLAHAVVPAMLRQGSGVFINIASKAAVDHAAGASAYTSSKAAVVALMDSLAADVKGTGVRVNSILPSIIDTAVNRSAMPGAKFDQWPKPEEIASVILFLASDQATVINGASIPVYGNS